MAIPLGIDLGTTYSVAAILEDGRPRIIPNAEGQRLTPSVGALTEDGNLLVGQLAKRQAATNPQGTVFSIKRYMGSDHRVRLGQRDYTPQEISALVLSKLKGDVENFLGERVDQAVITVPAYFNDRQRQATKEAGLLAGLDVLRIINEPTAATLAYGVDREEAHTVLVWDLGGGTFDISILDLGEGIFEVRAVSGDSMLGGDDHDLRLMEYLAQEFRRQYQVDLSPHDGMVWQMLREAAEKAKIELSIATTARVRLPLGGRGKNGLSLLDANVTRDRFQELTADLVERMVGPTRQALADAGLEAHQVDRVILVGGATRMPAVRAQAREMLGKEPYCSLDPDEVVALGAAIQAGVLLGTLKKVVLLDVLPLSLGIETQGGLFARIIPRNTPLPASEAQVFTTAADNQPSVDIHVLQGERGLALYNVALGTFRLEDIPPLPKGTPKIEVAFEADVDGIVHVSATDLLTQAKESAQVVSSKTLQREEMERMVSEARAKAEADSQQRERIQAGLQADNLISVAEGVLEELAGPSANPSVGQIQAAIISAKEALTSGDVKRMRRRNNELYRLVKSAKAPGTPPGKPPAAV